MGIQGGYTHTFPELRASNETTPHPVQTAVLTKMLASRAKNQSEGQTRVVFAVCVGQWRYISSRVALRPLQTFPKSLAEILFFYYNNTLVNYRKQCAWSICPFHGCPVSILMESVLCDIWKHQSDTPSPHSSLPHGKSQWDAPAQCFGSGVSVATMQGQL